ncbi:sorting nexin lst-4-like [Actinia tenebrosa]|uniref:Sorting nexin lst-4-like n=1 Tax=Actinia tenebrosa TaxID=6105 RepID=A0A6P8IY72_ACTTE|nr:sorting nexin lst-4-like [Actinia tenebrosa]
MAGRKVRVLYDFDGDPASGELIISTDEVLLVTSTDVGEGWWEGTNSSGTRGLFPQAYVEFLEDGPPPPPTMMHPPVMPALVPSAPSAPAAQNYHTSSPENDDGEGWDDDWDEDTGSSYSGGDSQVSSMPRRDTASSIQRTGTVRKSINRFSVFVKSGGEAYLLGTSNDKAHSCPAGERVTIRSLDGVGSASMTWQLSAEPFTALVTEPEKKSKFKGMKSFIAYNVGKSNSSTVVSRRFKHFDWLFNRLVEKYTLIAIPPIPDKQITGRFGEDFVEKRREKLEMWLNRICQHPVLSNCSVVTHFLTCSDSEKDWKAGKRKAENDKFMGAAFFNTVDNPPTKLSVYAVENYVENFGRFVKAMDDNVKNIVDRGTTHCEKCTGSYKSEYKKIGVTFTGLAQAFSIEDSTPKSGSFKSPLSWEISNSKKDSFALDAKAKLIKFSSVVDEDESRHFIMAGVEYTFRTPHGRLTESFHTMTTLHEVRKRIGRATGCEVANLLVGFPPKPVEGHTLEAVDNNQVIIIAEGPEVEIIRVKEEPKDLDEPCPHSIRLKDPPVKVLEAKRLIATEIAQQKIAQKVICKVILGVSQGRLCQLMQDTAYDNTILAKPYQNKSLEHYHKIYEFLTNRTPMERYNLYCSAAWRIEKERVQRKESFAASAASSTGDLLVVPRVKLGGRGKRTYIPNFAKKAMENYFMNTSRFITQETREFFSRQLKLPEETVQFYFKNLRAREKKGSFVPVS